MFQASARARFGEDKVSDVFPLTFDPEDPGGVWGQSDFFAGKIFPIFKKPAIGQFGGIGKT